MELLGAPGGRMQSMESPDQLTDWPGLEPHEEPGTNRTKDAVTLADNTMVIPGTDTTGEARPVRDAALGVVARMRAEAPAAADAPLDFAAMAPWRRTPAATAPSPALLVADNPAYRSFRAYTDTEEDLDRQRDEAAERDLEQYMEDEEPEAPAADNENEPDENVNTNKDEAPDAGKAEEADALDGADLLNQVRAAIKRYVVLPNDESADAVALWIAATHAVPAWEHATRMGITAPEKRCGKTRLLDVTEALVYGPLVAFNATVAAIYRSIDAEDPATLLFDEFDTIFGSKRAAENNEDLRALLNAGHGRGKPVLRCSGPNSDVKAYPSFAMVALAGIGDLPDTVADRAVIIRMRRRLPGETVQPFRIRRDAKALHVLRDELTKWMRKHLDELKTAEPEMPVEDRAADTWESLVAVADLAGGDWPQRARDAAKKFNGIAEEAGAAEKLTTRLLADLRAVFGDQETMHGITILAALHRLEDAPWGDYYGRPLNQSDLAKLLKRYGVASKDVKIGGHNLKGYSRADLWDVWQRYLPPLKLDDGTDTGTGAATGATSATAQLNPVAPETEVAAKSATARAAENGVAATGATGQVGATGLTSQVAQVAEVAPNPPMGADRPPADDACGLCGQRMDRIYFEHGAHPWCLEEASQTVAA